MELDVLLLFVHLVTLKHCTGIPLSLDAEEGHQVQENVKRINTCIANDE